MKNYNEKEKIKSNENKRKIIIDFLFLDLTVCTRCQGADNSLEDALEEVSKILEAKQIDVVVNEINVINEELAIKHKFISSPTIRVNGRDIQMDIKESLCESCGELCADEVDCRVWTYNDREYTVPPKAMIIEALLKGVYENGKSIEDEIEYVIPDNLKTFYSSLKTKNDSCC